MGEHVADERLVIDRGDETDLGDDKQRLDRKGVVAVVVSFVDFEVVGR